MTEKSFLHQTKKNLKSGAALGGRILFSTPVQLRKQKYAKEPAQLVLSLKFQSDQHAQMIPYNCWERRENSLYELQLQDKKQLFYQ